MGYEPNVSDIVSGKDAACSASINSSHKAIEKVKIKNAIQTKASLAKKQNPSF